MPSTGSSTTLKPAAKSVLQVASLIALLTVLSKGIGFLREVVIANYFGAGIPKDAYAIAYILPAMALILFGGLNGPFHTSTLAAITRLQADNRESEIPSVANTLLVWTAILMGIATLLVFIGAPGIISVLAPAAKPAVRALAIQQLQVMSPLVFFGCLIGCLCGLNNSRQEFALPSLSPIVASVAVMGIIAIWPNPMALAYGTLVGALGQFILQIIPSIPLLRRAPLVSIKHPAVKEMGVLLLPAMLSSSIGTINATIGLGFAAMLPIGAISAFDYANKLIQLPLGVLLTALLVPLFPLLTSAVTKDDRPTLFRWLNRGMETIAVSTFPLTVLILVLGLPSVRILFERGQFDAHATMTTFMILVFAGLSIAPYAARDLLTRVFYAMNDSRRPLMLSVLSIGFNFLFNWIFVQRLGVIGLSISTTLVTVVNLGLMAFWLRKRLGTLGLGASLATTLKSLVASVAVGVLVWQLQRIIPFPHGKMGDLIQVVGLGGLYAVAYAGSLWLLKVPFLAQLRLAQR